MTEVSDQRDALRELLRELVKAALISDPELIAAARARGLAAHAKLGGDVGGASGVWASAVREAEADPAVARAEVANPILPATLPVPPATLGGAAFDFDAAARIIRESSSFG